ncbi:hypothetical protein V496_01471 [Pseudogymnoascus sp. VKM F-4515 (FW-2607)]|nr:hypothetical protein V496_01471 [Pseudogymnoascus sp. VKM F-4515 (FW-2607)]
MLDQILNRFCIRLEEVFSDSNKPARIDEWFSYLAWDAASQLTFSQPLGFLDSGTDIEDTIKDTNQSFRYFATIGQMPFLDFWLDKNPFVRIGPPAFAHALNFTREQLTKRNMNKPHNAQDFLQCFLETKTAHPDVMDDEQVLTNSFMNIIGAAHSTAISLKAVMYYVHKNPRVLRKLQYELDEAKLELPVSYTAAQQLPYLNAVIKESLRMHPGIGLVMERVVPEGGLYLKNGYAIPKGTIVGMNPWVVHRDKDVFGPDAESFNPERWLQPDTEISSMFQERMSRMNSATLTFGAGKRVCIGQDFSMMEISKVTATILSKYKFEFVDPAHEWHIMGHWFMTQVDISMTVKRR